MAGISSSPFAASFTELLAGTEEPPFPGAKFKSILPSPTAGSLSAHHLDWNFFSSAISQRGSDFSLQTHGARAIESGAAPDMRPEDDGYNWKKYGMKQVQGSENRRSYYRCTHPNCATKKKVERSSDGQVTEIMYKGAHSHPKPLFTRRNSASSPAAHAARPLKTGMATDSAFGPDNSPVSGDDPGAEEFNEEEKETIRKETRLVVQTPSDVDVLDDGYRWRKYGQKAMKGNLNPRSYYKCTAMGCSVRKHVERAPSDRRSVITTYEGRHNHDVPTSRGSTSRSRPSPAVAARPLWPPPAASSFRSNNFI